MKYIEEFLNRNSNKSFVTNLKKYIKLKWLGKIKTVSSFLTHIIIDAEQGVDNHNLQIELLSILTEMILYKNDNFLEWLEQKIQ